LLSYSIKQTVIVEFVAFATGCLKNILTVLELIYDVVESLKM